MQDLKTILFLADGHKQPAGATKKPESWTLASTHLSGDFVGRFQQPLFPKGIFGGLKISEPSHSSRFNIWKPYRSWFWCDENDE